ncbi:MAG: hypothetical protein ACRDD1_05055, partial [Planctomycetia bacterium]
MARAVCNKEGGRRRPPGAAEVSHGQAAWPTAFQLGAQRRRSSGETRSVKAVLRNKWLLGGVAAMGLTTGAALLT